ncbi:platelet-derived growth factor receptor alpha, partial [Eurytemora carolleeae]|uniref:platelet-derived growth factor receptor alpha n=1 Tax=Eurytemora carolleeae TaxID=1294199 RepID=UPI000C78D7C9
MNKIMISLSLLLPLSLAARNTRYVEYRPPVVFPNQDFLTVSARLNITLTCEGHKSVNWFLPTGSNSIGDRVSITSSSHSNREGKYVASLNLRDMVYTDTGTYRCSFNDSEDGTSIDSNTMIHLYVYDHVHLLTKDDFDFQQFVQYDTAVIPCMTTQPNVTVELKLQETIVPDNQYIQFNPK